MFEEIILHDFIIEALDRGEFGADDGHLGSIIGDGAGASATGEVTVKGKEGLVKKSILEVEGDGIQGFISEVLSLFCEIFRKLAGLIHGEKEKEGEEEEERGKRSSR